MAVCADVRYPHRPMELSQLVEDSVFILQCLRQNQRGGRQNGLAEVRSTLEGSVALDPGAYVAFLRRFGYVEVDHDAVKVTEQGEKAAVGDADLTPDVQKHFDRPEITQPEAKVPVDGLVTIPSPKLAP